MPSPFEFGPFRELLDAVVVERIDAFADLVEPRFLAAMSAFDTRQAAGQLSSGQNQNKGLFFNELIGRLLENCAGVGVAKRGKRAGVLLDKVDVDLCYPLSGPPAVIAEMKMAGTPQHPGNIKKTPPQGRRASADTAKRIREIALNVIDLKLADAAGGSAPIGDISTWIQAQRPAVFAMLGLRLTGDDDYRLSIRDAQRLANSYANGVGLALYRPRDIGTAAGRTDYLRVPPPGGLSIDDALRRMCRQIRAGG